MHDEREPRRFVLSRSHESGFGLTEVLVSMGLTVLVLAGAFRAFDDARRMTDAGSMLADGTQNLRMATTMMTRDIMQTGRGLPIGGIPIPRGSGVADIVRPGPPGESLAFSSDWTTLPSVVPGNDLGPTVNGLTTDVITVLFADPTLPLNDYPLTSVLADGSRMTVDSRTALNEARTAVKAGDLILFTNALGNAIQTVTSVSGQNVYFVTGDSSDTFGFNQRTATSGSVMQIRDGTVFPTTSATRVTMVSYYIDATTADGQMRLMRREAFHGARLVGLGIENLQCTFDVVDGTVNPTAQADITSPYSPSQARKVNLLLASRSDDELQNIGRRIRSSITTQVSLRSMSFRDRYQ